MSDSSLFGTDIDVSRCVMYEFYIVSLQILEANHVVLDIQSNNLLFC